MKAQSIQTSPDSDNTDSPTAATAASHESLQAQDVLDWLKANPDFVRQHPQALEYLHLDHSAGAPSLLEKQIQVLRSRNDQLRVRLHDLADAARANEQRVKHTNRLATRLMEADSAELVVQVLVDSLKADFSVDAVYVGLYQQVVSQAICETIPDAESIGPEHPARAELRNLIRTGVIECDAISDARRAVLFADTAVASAAVVPLDRASPIGFLAVASDDPARYTPGAGTMFLDLIAALTSAALRRCLAA